MVARMSHARRLKILLVEDHADTLETVLFAVIMRRREPARYYPGVAEDAFYSYFMVAVWIPCYVTVYLVPRWV